MQWHAVHGMDCNIACCGQCQHGLECMTRVMCHLSLFACWLQAVDHALSAGADRFSHNDIERVTGLQTALRLKPAEVQVPATPPGQQLW